MAADDRKLAIERLRVRAEMRSADLEENTGEIEVAAVSRAPKSTSQPPRARFVLALLNAKPSWQMVAIVAIVVAALVGGGVLRPVLDHVMGWAK